LPSMITRGEIVILAVKPQNFYELSGELTHLQSQGLYKPFHI